jgi:hypothetical protein
VIDIRTARYDICFCGDFRHQHEGFSGACVTCRAVGPGPIPMCQRFRFSKHASEDEVAYQERLELICREAFVVDAAPGSRPSPVNELRASEEFYA